MRWFDRFLQRQRFNRASRFIAPGARLLDVGCFDDALLLSLRARIAPSVGIDPLIAPRVDGALTFIQGEFPGVHSRQFESESFDCITILAALEHIPDTNAVAAECFRILKSGGRVVITVPDRRVDYILAVLLRFKLIKGMSLEQHYGYEVGDTQPIFTRHGFKLVIHQRFQLGLNNLFVFEK